jgi:hypothetical protein
LYFEMTSKKSNASSKCMKIGQDREVVALVLVPSAIAFTLGTGMNGRVRVVAVVGDRYEDRYVSSSILVTSAIAATFVAGADGRVRALAISGIGITAAFLIAPAGPETYVRASACIARPGRFNDGASAGMVIAATCLGFVK